MNRGFVYALDLALVIALAHATGACQGGGEIADPCRRTARCDGSSRADAARRDGPRPLRDAIGEGRASAGDASLDGRSAPDAPGPCPRGMVAIDRFCIDRYEAPNVKGADALVMYSFDEAVAWCRARSKRLCYDDEWTKACTTTAGWLYPYGNQRQPGRCNDNKIWRTYSQTKLSGWPWNVSKPQINSLSQLLAAARAASSSGAIAADHVKSLYQGVPSGSLAGCTNALGAFDTVGNVEEWTRRRDGGSGSQFLGNLKGRYWADSRTCLSNVKVHGNGFRFYEIGFRCCADQR